MQAPAHITPYPPERSLVRLGVVVAIGIHIFLAVVTCLILYLMGIQSLKELLDKGGALASSGPAPEQPMVVELKLDDIKPPPTDVIEFQQQVLKPKPQPVIPKPPPTPPTVKPVVKTRPKITAPKATGAGNSDTVSNFVVGSSGFPHPSYPYNLLSAHIGGTVYVRVVFDSSGAASEADVVQSSGTPELDATTRNFILAHWKNASEANQVLTGPVIYQPPP